MSSSAERHSSFTLRLETGGFVRLTWPHGSRVTGSLAQDAMDAVDALNAGRERGLFVDMTSTAELTREARHVFAQRCSASAIALVGRSAVDRVIANFALGVSAVPVPTRFFTSESLAEAWLHDVEPDA